MKQQRIKKAEASMSPSLPPFELLVYVIVWTCTIYIVLERVYVYASEYKPFYTPGNFEEGWLIFGGRDKDISEYEWYVWSNQYISLIPWVITYISISQLLWWKNPQIISYFYIIFSTISMIRYMGLFSTVYLITQALFMFPTYLFKSRIFCWIIGMSLLIIINIHPFSQYLEYIVPLYSTEEYMLSVVTAWLNIRSLSFCLHRCTEPRKGKSFIDDLIHYLAFCFYFPILYTGPLMMYSDFERQLLASRPKLNWKKVVALVGNIFRYIFWFLFNEAILHFFYMHALRSHLNLLSKCPRSVLAGVGYAISQFFMNKYTVLYGLPGAISKLEHFETPAKPKCIARIHLYSDMWRYFDQGLYNFFIRYIYVPALGESKALWKKIAATTLCFTFVFFWHGTTFPIFVWAFLNYVEVILEMFASMLGSTEIMVKFEHRFHTLLSKVSVCTVRVKYLLRQKTGILSKCKNRRKYHRNNF